MPSELEGLTGKVSVPIGTDRAGEILLEVRGCTQAYTARSSDHAALVKDERVVVIEQISARTVLVAACP